MAGIGAEPLRRRIVFKLHRALEGWGKISPQRTGRPHTKQLARKRAWTEGGWGCFEPMPTYLGSTELSGLDFGGDATFGSATVLPEDACGASGEGPGGFGSISLAEVRRCSFTSFSRDLALCSARRRSNCFFRPGTALRWLSECV